MPAALENTRWNIDPSRPVGSDARDSRLKNAMTLDDAPEARVEARSIQRMRHFADHPRAAPRGRRVSASSVIT